MVLVHVDSFVMHTTSVSSSTWMLSVSSNSSVTVGHMTSHMPCLSQSCDLHSNLGLVGTKHACALTISSKIDRFNKYIKLKLIRSYYPPNNLLLNTTQLFIITLPVTFYPIHSPIPFPHNPFTNYLTINTHTPTLLYILIHTNTSTTYNMKPSL